MIVGIDEAGRGPAMGPLVLCGVGVPRDRLRTIEALGLKDSKAYGSGPAALARRAELAEQIAALATVRIEVAEAAEVDCWTAQGGLNRLEQRMATRVIERLGEAEELIADGARLFAPLRAAYPHLRALDGADAEHPIVAAASIVAKAERDRRLAALLAPHEPEFGPIRGGGYPNAATADFLRRYVEHYRALPPFVRTSWSWAVLGELHPRCTAPRAALSSKAR